MSRRSSSGRSLLAVGDTHFPYASERVLRDMVKFAKSEKPQILVQIGDLYDLYCFSRYPRNPNKETPESELDRGRAQATSFWHRLREASPEAYCIQLLGNHDARLSKRVAETLPELSSMLHWRAHLFSFAGVNVARSDRDVTRVTVAGEPVALHHGYLSKLGDHAAHFQCSTIVGHTHRGGVAYHGAMHNSRRALFELNCGFVGDARQHVFGYGAAPHKWTPGWGYVDHNGPRFVRA